MTKNITSIAGFGETTTDVDVEEDCWLLLGDVTKAIMNRSVRPPDRRSGQVIYAAFPGRTNSVKKGE